MISKIIIKKPSDCYNEVVFIQPYCSWVANIFKYSNPTGTCFYVIGGKTATWGVLHHPILMLNEEWATNVNLLALAIVFFR